MRWALVITSAIAFSPLPAAITFIYVTHYYADYCCAAFIIITRYVIFIIAPFDISIRHCAYYAIAMPLHYYYDDVDMALMIIIVAMLFIFMPLRHFRWYVDDDYAITLLMFTLLRHYDIIDIVISLFSLMPLRFTDVIIDAIW